MGKGKVLATNGVREDNLLMIADFNMSRQANEKLTRCVWHTSLSFSKSDSLDDDKMLRIAEEWMKEMGLSNTQWAIIKHTDTEHPHIHILASRIDNNNKTISDSNNYMRSMNAIRRLEKEFGLSSIPEVRQENEINQQALKGRDKFKSECHKAIQDSLRKSKNIEEFTQAMKDNDISCLFKYNPDGSPRGLSFQKGEMKIKASDINRIYSAKSISRYLDHNNDRAQKRTHRQAAKVRHEVKDAAYQFSRAMGDNDSIDDDIVRIDKVLNPIANNKKSLGYGR